MSKEVFYALDSMKKGLNTGLDVTLSILSLNVFTANIKVDDMYAHLGSNTLTINNSVSFNLSDWVYVNVLGSLSKSEQDNEMQYCFLSKAIDGVRITINIENHREDKA